MLGAQGVGEEGVERRIDVISMAIQKHGTVFDLEECELCYAPQYGSAKDPINIAGMIASNVMHGDASLASWAELPSTDALILDVRDPVEHQSGSIKGAVNLPLNQLRERLGELPREREIWVHCGWDSDPTMRSGFSSNMDSKRETCPVDTRLFARGTRTACSAKEAGHTRKTD